MRAILNLATPEKAQVLRVCQSVYSSVRAFAMLQMEPPKKPRRLAIVELSTARHRGDIVPQSEFTIVHSEK